MKPEEKQNGPETRTVLRATIGKLKTRIAKLEKVAEAARELSYIPPSSRDYFNTASEILAEALDELEATE